MQSLSRTIHRPKLSSAAKIFGLLFVILSIIASALSFSLPRGSKAAGEELTVKPAADTFVASRWPDRNYGAFSHIDVRGTPAVSSYLRFEVRGLGQGSVAQAHLRLFALQGSGGKPASLQVFATAADWNEKTISWGKRPAPGQPIATSAPAPIEPNQWIDLDLGAAVTGDGTYSFALTTDSASRLAFRSRSRAEAPQLVLTLQPTAAPQPTAAGDAAAPEQEVADDPTLDDSVPADTQALAVAAAADTQAAGTNAALATAVDPANQWHPATDHEHGDNCAQPLPNNPFVALGNPPLDMLGLGEPHNGFKQFLLYKKDGSGNPVAGTFACVVFHIGPLTSKARTTDRHQVHIMMQDGKGHMTNAVWQFQNHGAGPTECDTVSCGGRWRDGSHNKDLAMETEVKSSGVAERWWIDTQDDAGVDENGLIDLYTSVRIEDAATYVQRNELPSDLSQMANTLFDPNAPLHFTCAKLNVTGFCPHNDSTRSTGTWHISIKKTGVFWTDAQGHPVAQGTPGAVRQELYTTSRDYSGLPKVEYDTKRTVVWPN
jgi:hypothetical protein